MSAPKVTFLVPCYKLAHVLGSCIQSILAQSYRDFELLVMDDCSPDHTAEVVAAFSDPRIRHVRHEVNLGHLRNYNAGIELAAGQYIWLISADDRLRSDVVLERYVSILDAHPSIGFAFCPGIGLIGERETDLVGWATLPGGDAIFSGARLLLRLLESNCVLAPSALVRKKCYDAVGVFPLDLPYAGDWYMWCAIAAQFDVAYLSEPMVNYREHGLSMTTTLIAEDMWRLCSDDFTVRWRVKKLLERSSRRDLVEKCRTALVDDYVRALAAKTWRGSKFRMTLRQFDESLATHCGDPSEGAAIRRAVFSQVGQHLFWDGDLPSEPAVYRLALRHSANLRLAVKYGIARLGPVGGALMSVLSSLRPVKGGRAR